MQWVTEQAIGRALRKQEPSEATKLQYKKLAEKFSPNAEGREEVERPFKYDPDHNIFWDSTEKQHLGKWSMWSHLRIDINRLQGGLFQLITFDTAKKNYIIKVKFKSTAGNMSDKDYAYLSEEPLTRTGTGVVNVRDEYKIVKVVDCEPYDSAMEHYYLGKTGYTKMKWIRGGVYSKDL